MIEKLNGHLPDNVLAELLTATERYHITSALRLAHFLTQCDHESGGFKRIRENMNYSADDLKTAFGKYFQKVNPDNYAHQAEKIANRIYACRYGNGNEASGEGFKFRGRGFLQLTFKNNYLRFGESINIDLLTSPDLVATRYPLSSAAWFFDDNRLWKWCDVGPGSQAVFDVTKRINGGTHGVEERIELFNRYYALLK